jgi:hypothetical protein
MAANGFAPAASFQAVANGVAQSMAIPGTPATLRIVNLGPKIAYVALGASQPVAVTPQTGLAIEPDGPPEFLTVGSNTFLGIATDAGGFYARLNITTGT